MAKKLPASNKTQKLSQQSGRIKGAACGNGALNLGVGAINITPLVGTDLSGYLHRVQPSIGIRDPLFARALYLENAGARLLWIHTDLIGFDRAFAAEMKGRLAGRFELRPEQIVLTATHTHAGPATVSLTLCGESDESYLAWLKEQLIECAARAVRRTESTQAFFAEGTCGLAVDRRTTTTPHADHRVGVVTWRRANGDYAAVLANYPMHNVGLGWENRLISGDIAGLAAAVVRQALPGAPVVLITNGACGNINPPRHAETDRTLASYGDALAASILTALADQARPLRSDCAALASEEIRVPLQSFGPDDVKRLVEGLRQPIAGQAGHETDRYRQALDHWERAMLPRSRAGTLPTSVALEIQILRFDDVWFACMGAEVFSRMADDLRAATGKQLYVVGYANGCIGYLPTPEAFAEEGYETGSAFIFYGGLPPRPEAFTHVRDRVVALVGRLSATPA